MAYANVFNRSANPNGSIRNTTTFPFEERSTRMGTLVKETMERKPYGDAERVLSLLCKILAGRKSWNPQSCGEVRPQGTDHFIWLTTPDSFDVRQSTGNGRQLGSR